MMGPRKRAIEALTADECLPLARTINALLLFRSRQWEGLEPFDAEPTDPDVRLLAAWLRSAAMLDAEQPPKGGAR